MSGVPSSAPPCQRSCSARSASPIAAGSSRARDDAGAGLADQLRGGAVRRHGGEDRPLGGEVLEDLPGEHALAAAARLRDQQQQRLGVALQLERRGGAATYGISSSRSPSPSVSAHSRSAGAEVADEAGDDVEAGLGERGQERPRVALAEEAARVRDPEALGRAVLEPGEVVEVAAVRDRHDAAARARARAPRRRSPRTAATIASAWRATSRATARSPCSLSRDEPLSARRCGCASERVAQVGDPARAGRALHGRADEVDRARRRRRQHDVDPLAARTMRIAAGIAVRFQRDVLVRDEQPAPERAAPARRSRSSARRAVQLLGRAAALRADVARAVDPRLRRRRSSSSRCIHFGSSGASTCVSMPSAGRCVANFSGRCTPPPPAGGK